jgi:hypothetical protein
MIIAGIIVEGPNTGARADASTVVNPAALGAVNAQAAQFAALSAAGQAAELAKAAAELAKFGLPLPR